MHAPSSPEWPVPVSVSPDKLASIQAEFSKGWADMLFQAQQGTLAPPSDRRFKSNAWAANPYSLVMAHAYLLSGKAIQQMVDAAQLPERARERLRFTCMQWVEAMSPSNFLATNPDVQQRMLDSRGESLRAGLNSLWADIQKGRITQTDETRFKVGQDLALTEGQVVYENRLMQLIQYAPLTPTVHQLPLLMVPPCINKFYILDLQPHNSFVRHAVEQGFTVFMVSWRNPQVADDDGIDTATWSDYLQEGVLEAVQAVRDITRQKQINALGFCVGGTLLASALALAKARGEDPVASLTLLTTLLDFSDTGVLDVFVDEFHAEARECQLNRGGLMSARELATTFSFLRPNELVWNYVVDNYLKGQAPQAFDLLFWNADGTNLPGPFFTWYFRNAYLENRLKAPGHVKIDGHALDFGSLSMPAYIYGSREDHIVPWRSAYASTALLRGPMRFVLGASGHIAGVVNPPSQGKRSYWAAPGAVPHADMPGDPDLWHVQCTEHPGSWWPDWSQWLAAHSGPRKKASGKLGNARYAPIEPAPGRYVTVRSQ
ncbi:class I poly(R)-hydroxyalkanoic acid synthase [Pusillimonas sp.]|uniref:class I poly(R)-hydroxyalkanoic acid synthase n=1 Tax=Pusillimonas sp. TaxID=3040095 RepID=UPI0029A1DA2B|nr:class I poly(R)-hydroxyalkanoic acid synthase [Pusillimonas sp.]MDX3894296.1 class I poly(R)-hydroxyalkanoic acid synthase [Pusillimonas sp.]